MKDSLSALRLADASRFKWMTLIHMLRTRFLKYAVWMLMMTVAKFLACVGEVLTLFGSDHFKDARKRARILDFLYWVMHATDDIVDNDAPVPEEYSSARAYVERLIEFISFGDTPRDHLERTLGYVIDLAATLGMDLRSGIKDILDSMLFDAVRLERKGLSIASAEELDHHFHLLDIRGTIGLWLLILRERRDAYHTLAMLGEAVRIYYNLRDLHEDMCARLCNIPREAFAEFAIPVPSDLSPTAITVWCELPQVRAWRAAEAHKGMELFKSFMRQKTSLQLHAFTNWILTKLFEGSAEKGLRLHAAV